MNITEIKVKNCKHCPFSQAETNFEGIKFYMCFAPVQIHKGKYDIKSYYESYKKPNWCPLNNRELIITT